MASPVSRIKSQRAIKLTLVLLTVVFAAEALGGYFTNSLALLSDAAHLLTDLGALLAALVAFWIGGRPASRSRTYGYQRTEIIAALANGVTLWVVAGYIVYEGYQRLADPPEIRAPYMSVIAAAGFIGQAVGAFLLYRASRESLNARGAFIHVATDAVQSVGVIIAGLLILFRGWYLLDPIISLIIAVLVAWSGGRVAWQALHILLEGTPSEVNLPSLKYALETVYGVEEVHDLHVWTITSGYNAMSAHVMLKDRVSPDRARVVLSALRQLSKRRFSIEHVTIQLEDRDMSCTETHTTV